MVEQLHQPQIIKKLKEHGIHMAPEELKNFLDRHTVMGRLVISPRGRGIDRDVDGDKPHRSRWYDVVSPGFTGEQADQHIVAYILEQWSLDGS